MPKKKQYLRYEQGTVFGVVCSRQTGALLIECSRGDDKKKKRVVAAAPALENVILWDLKRGEKVGILSGGKSEVTSLSFGTGPNPVLAAGYEDGSVRLWDVESCDCQVMLSGHKSAVTSLVFDESSTRLVSGSKDTDVIVWDVINQSGLFRLKGHKAPVTACRFVAERDLLITSSKDSVVKLWDLSTQHCYQTLVGHRSEVWGVELMGGASRLVTASSSRQLRVYSVMEKDQEGVVCTEMGVVNRQNNNRVYMTASDNEYLAVLSGEHSLEMYRLRTDEELDKILKKKQKRARKRREKAGEDVDSEEMVVELSASDELVLCETLNSTTKIKWFSMSRQSNGDIQILLSMCNNSLELYSYSVSESSFSRVVSLSLPGHRSDIRCVSFSSDGDLIASGSSDMIKIWRRSNQQCLHTSPSGYAVCCVFVPGNRHLLVGTKTGELLLYEVNTGSLLETISAHDGAVWSLALSPDRRGFASGSADHNVKFWEFELVSCDDQSDRSRLSAAHVKTLQMNEDVLGVKYSPNHKLLAVALLDSTVKVFFADTLKFFLSLYGHKLPVLSMDISTDSSLMVTGSSDKNIRIWGMDFGDCHRSIFAHNDSIMAVQFVRKTHLFFSVSKDRTIKQWDADQFELVQTLKGHQAEVWALAVSNDGNTVVTGSHDCSLRLWECTQELLIPSLEAEAEREAQFEEAAAEEAGHMAVDSGDGEVASAGKRSLETVKAAERIIAAIELYNDEEAKMVEYRSECEEAGKKLAPPAPHPLLVAMGKISHSHHALNVLSTVHSSELEEALLVLPFFVVEDLLQLLANWLKEGRQVELCCRCGFFLLRVHHHQIVSSSKQLLHVLDTLRQHTHIQVDSFRDMLGFNLSGLHHVGDLLQSSTGQQLFQDSIENQRIRRKRRRVI